MEHRTGGRALEKEVAGALPARGEFVLRNGYVLTMDAELGDIPDADVHVKNGEIIAIGTNLKAPAAIAIDASRMIVLPGLIDTHWHMWTTFLRCMAGDNPHDGYFPMTTAYGQAMNPEDMYNSTLLAAAEAIYSGTTTVNDECHNVRSPDFAVADIRALQDAGLRARWSYGAYRGIPAGQLRDLEHFEKLHQTWADYSKEGLLSIGFAWGGVGCTAFPISADSVAAARKEFEAIRRLDAPISMHLSAKENTASGWIDTLARENFLGRDVLLIHGLSASPEEMKLMARSGASISVSPGAELRIGYGLTKACDFAEAGVNVCVSADSVPLTGNAHLFGVLKLLRNVENAKAFSEFKLSARRALQFATINGARALGIDHLVGSLTPGKRADLIAIRTDVITMGVFTDPTHMLVEATEPANVDTVVVDGRILKRAGKFTSLLPEQIIAGASASLKAVSKRLNRN